MKKCYLKIILSYQCFVRLNRQRKAENIMSILNIKYIMLNKHLLDTS